MTLGDCATDWARQFAVHIHSGGAKKSAPPAGPAGPPAPAWPVAGAGEEEPEAVCLRWSTKFIRADGMASRPPGNKHLNMMLGTASGREAASNEKSVLLVDRSLCHERVQRALMSEPLSAPFVRDMMTERLVEARNRGHVHPAGEVENHEQWVSSIVVCLETVQRATQALQPGESQRKWREVVMLVHEFEVWAFRAKLL